DLTNEYAGTTDQRIPKLRDVMPLNGQYLGVGSFAHGAIDPLTSRYGSGRLDWYGRSGWVATAEAGTARVENELYNSGSGRYQRTAIDRPWARLNLGSERYN